MDDREFDLRLLQWLDGELPADAAAEMQARCDSDVRARARAEAERAFDARVRAALLSDGDGREIVAAALRKARAEAGTSGPGAAAPRRGRLLHLPRWATGLSAAAALVVGFMWFNCIPPFECAVLQAMERAADAPAEGHERVEGRDSDCVLIDCEGVHHGDRSRLPLAGGDALLIRCADDLTPSFRHRFDQDGREWWNCERGGRRLVAFRDPLEGGLWCLVGTQDADTIYAAAKRLCDERVCRVK